MGRLPRRLLHAFVNDLRHRATRCASDSLSRTLVANMVIAALTLIAFAHSRWVHNHHKLAVRAGVSVCLKVARHARRELCWNMALINLKMSQPAWQPISDYKHACPNKLTTAPDAALNVATNVP
jgi:hypothetical protein